ncbi:hypothetical protein SAY87_017653 [Trapa incisa]|uniref:Uncharacterized protein n=1 Tax=Trapa incisa TaxID=236973 RepID=A0AAN7QUF9_9MYRT|nr:hypothetical protein SAY87_017653 [Trapa incisa]
MLIALTSCCLMMNESPSFVSYSLPRLSLVSFIACSVMAVEERQVSNDEDLPLKLPHHPPPPPSFLEVTCKGSEKPRRFAAGTEAGFAVSMINRKLGNGFKPVALYIEAVKDGEEPVAFGPNSVLADYGAGWKLQAVTADVDIAGDPMAGGFRPKTTRIRASVRTSLPHYALEDILKSPIETKPENKAHLLLLWALFFFVALMNYDLLLFCRTMPAPMWLWFTSPPSASCTSRRS